MVSNTRYGEQESACILTDPMTHLTCDLIEVAFVRNRGVGQVPSTLLTTNALPGPSIDTTTTEKGSFKLPDARSLHRYRFSNLIPLNHGARRSVIQRRRGTCAFEKTHKKKTARGRTSQFSELRREAKKGNWMNGGAAGRRGPCFGGGGPVDEAARCEMDEFGFIRPLHARARGV